MKGKRTVDRVARTISKYPNRRLFDTAERRFLTLEEFRALVAQGLDVSVVDRITGEDITKPLLIQVLGVMEQQRGQLLTDEFLLQAIRSHHTQADGLAASYLEQSLNLFFDDLKASTPSGPGRKEPPEATAQRLAEHNFRRWRAHQTDIDRRLKAAALRGD